MARRLSSYGLDDPVQVLLMCGCRMMASITSVFERKSYECPWQERKHGSQSWVRFDPSGAGYVVHCVDRGCSVRRDYDLKFLVACSFAASHSRLHCHPVKILADDWVGRKIVPEILDGLPGF